MKIRLPKKLAALLPALCIALSLAPITATTAFAESATVSSEVELTTALEDADCPEIKLGSNVEISQFLTVKRTVTLDLNGNTLTCSNTDTEIIRLWTAGNLTVKDSGTGGTIDGQNKNYAFNVRGGTLTLESGTIANCTTDGDGGAVDVSRSGTIEYPLDVPGKFIMNGGTIKNCSVEDDGGAVDVGRGCTFIMNNGTIDNCRAKDDGGVVSLKGDSLFEMTGGLIQNSLASYKGGFLYIEGTGRFTMTGGTVKSCFADIDGVGFAVYGDMAKARLVVAGGTFEKCGATPYSFADYTHIVTFDSDGGTAVSRQTVMNASAVKPADPTKSGYTFAGWYLGDAEYAFDTEVTENIELKARWTSTAADEKEIEAVEINNVTLTFKDGDVPVFTGTVSDPRYRLIFEAWKTDGEGISSEEWFNNDEHLSFWGGKLITAFDKNKTYTYMVYLTTSEQGSLDGWYFGSNTKLKINGQEVQFSRVPSDNVQQFSADAMTMTPQASGASVIVDFDNNQGGSAPSGNNPGAVAPKIPKTGDSVNFMPWIALLLVSGGVLVVATVFGKRKKYNR